MTKNQAIGLVLLRVSGGRPTADMSVREMEIRDMIAVAANYAIDRGDNMNREEDRGRDYLNQFYGQYTAPVDQSGNQAFFIMEDKTVPLKGNNGLRLVYDNCGNYYGKLSDADRPSIKYYSKLTPCMKWYSRTGQRVNLYGEGALTATVNYEALTDINDIGDDDELPLVAGTEPEFLDILYALATGQMGTPYDPIINNDDINKAQL